jgi:hypothetical protein
MKTIEFDNLNLFELNQTQQIELNGGCEDGFCVMGFWASFYDGLANGWNAAKASWDTTVKELS